MSRVAKQPVTLPAGVSVTATENLLSVKGKKGELSTAIPSFLDVTVDGNTASLNVDGATERGQMAMAGTLRALLANMAKGVSEGWEKRLQLIGVGYRAQLQGKTLNLTLGHSHPISYAAPDGISFEVPSQTEIVVKGFDKQVVGQVAADIRAFRPPEPYKGKGVRYLDEYVVRKEAKKKK